MRRIGVRSETCTPRWVDSAMIGPAAMRATAEGSRAMTGASSGPEGEEEQGHDEQHRQQLDEGLDVAVLVLLVHRRRPPPGQVHGQARRWRREVVKVDTQPVDRV